MKVYVWMPNEEQYGHAALTLSNGTHISWWPEEEISGKKGMKTKTGPFYNPSLEDDILSEGRNPDLTVNIPGLDEAAVMSWWTSLQSSGSKYNVILKNCCHVVLDALTAGGFRTIVVGVPTPEKVASLIKNAPGAMIM